MKIYQEDTIITGRVVYEISRSVWLSYGIVKEKIAEEIPEGHLVKEMDFAVRDYVVSYPVKSMPCQNTKEQAALRKLNEELENEHREAQTAVEQRFILHGKQMEL